MMENSSGKHSSFNEKESPEEKAEREARKRKQKEVKEKQQAQVNKWFASRPKKAKKQDDGKPLSEFLGDFIVNEISPKLEVLTLVKS